jgi:hypothetical protein
MTHTKKQKTKKGYKQKEEGEGMKGIKEWKNEGKKTDFMWSNRTGMTKVSINKWHRKPVSHTEGKKINVEKG